MLIKSDLVKSINKVKQNYYQLSFITKLKQQYVQLTLMITHF